MTFDDRTFYRFECISQPGFTISSGIARDRNGTLDMTIIQNYSASENWQLFWQQDRYFIRNFDYAAGFQLGLTESDLFTPRLYTRSGALGQQWDIIPDNNGYKLSNGLLGNSSWLALPDGKATPTMQKDGSGLVWNITRNPSAETDSLVPNSLDMFSEVEDFEVVQASSSISSSASLASSSVSSSVSLTSAASIQVATPASIATSTGIAASPQSSPSILSPGSIAGIAISGVAVLGGVIFAIWFIAWKRKTGKARPQELYAQYSSDNSEVYEKSVDPVELGHKHSFVRAAELPGLRFS